MDPLELAQLCETDSEFRNRCRNSEFWRGLIIRDFPGVQENDVNHFTNPKGEYYRLCMDSVDRDIADLIASQNKTIHKLEREMERIKKEISTVKNSAKGEIRELDAYSAELLRYTYNITKNVRNNDLYESIEFGGIPTTGNIQELERYLNFTPVAGQKLLVYSSGATLPKTIYIYGSEENLKYEIENPVF